MALVDRFGKQIRRFGEYLEQRSTFDYSDRPRTSGKITQGSVRNPTSGLGTPIESLKLHFSIQPVFTGEHLLKFSMFSQLLQKNSLTFQSMICLSGGEHSPEMTALQQKKWRKMKKG